VPIRVGVSGWRYAPRRGRLRLHGDKKLYRSCYGDKALVRWAERISAWSRGGEPSDAIKAEPRVKPALRPGSVYCYFDDTDEKLRAPADAKALMRKLGLEQASFGAKMPAATTANPRTTGRPIGAAAVRLESSVHRTSFRTSVRLSLRRRS
jgi:uncharacterized protein YecE (DUF72 family)